MGRWRDNKWRLSTFMPFAPHDRDQPVRLRDLLRDLQRQIVPLDLNQEDGLKNVQIHKYLLRAKKALKRYLPKMVPLCLEFFVGTTRAGNAGEEDAGERCFKFYTS